MAVVLISIAVSVAEPLANSNIPVNSQNKWNHNKKETRFITELIAMDFGKGEVDSNGQPLAIGMDYRHRSYNGFESSNEGGFTTYENNMGFLRNMTNRLTVGVLPEINKTDIYQYDAICTDNITKYETELKKDDDKTGTI